MTRFFEVLFLIFLVVASGTSSTPDEFFEELDITPLPNGFLSSTFKFLTRHRGPLGNHYDLFPKAIGEIVQRYGVEEFHLSMSQNYWRTYQWGYQPQPATPTGAQLWAWFSERNGSDGVDTQWRDAVHALSGLFCASFSQIDTRHMTIKPEHEFRPRGVLSVKSSDVAADNRFLRYAILPSDNVCTENLSPWKKLLPCKSLSGIGTLLMGTKVFSGHYFSLNVDLRRVCANDAGKIINECSGEENIWWELTQTLNVVYDLAAAGQPTEWSFMSIFGNSISSHCPVAKSSMVYIDTHKKLLRTNLQSFKVVVANGNRRRYSAFDIRELTAGQNILNIGGTFMKVFSSLAVPPPPIHLHSFVAGSGVYSGRLVSRLSNMYNVTVPILYSHTIPWFLRAYYHTLKIVCNGQDVKPNSIVYKPGRDRKRPHYYEIAFDLPPSQDSWCDLSMKFDRALLRYTEYPPDANHGFPVAAPMITFYAPTVKNFSLLFTHEEPLLTFGSEPAQKNSSKKPMASNVLTVVFGKSLLINLPTPDFSMPYNVICLVCTVVALAFGPIHSLTTKTLIAVDSSKVPKSRAIDYLKTFLGWVKEIFYSLFMFLTSPIRKVMKFLLGLLGLKVVDTTGGAETTEEAEK